jgi:hypothetical protein
MNRTDPITDLAYHLPLVVDVVLVVEVVDVIVVVTVVVDETVACVEDTRKEDNIT